MIADDISDITSLYCLTIVRVTVVKKINFLIQRVNMMKWKKL